MKIGRELKYRTQALTTEQQAFAQQNASLAPRGLDLGSCRARWRRVAFDVVVVPRHEALHAVLEMRRHCEAVILARIDDEFGSAAKRFHRLIHLFAAENRNIPVDVATHEKSGSGDARDAVEG